MRVPGDGFRAWEDADIAVFEAAHPVGSRARLALALLLFTALFAWADSTCVAALSP